MFDVILFVVSAIAGAVAAVAGFGIGSLLTPLLAMSVGTKIAVATISVPHFIGTAIRFWRMRADTDRRVLWSFGISGLSGLAERMRFHGAVAWTAGAVSGLFGGLVGNQGGIRSAALLGFGLSRDAFVATATAIGLFVDAARMPVYLATQHAELRGLLLQIVIATAGVVLGTLSGTRLLKRIPEKAFRTIVSLLILALGFYMLVRGVQSASWT
ncbi:MAG TPA: TSUP family transporter [Vicinamibacterales bacterium]|nr:TSUP family transporter [Vicinamibacterales bacterium]